MPQHWRDRVGVLLGVLLFLSPWAIGFGSTGPAPTGIAAWSAWILGIAITVCFGIARGETRQWEEWVNVVLAILLFLCPFVFGYYATMLAAAWSQWVLAVLAGIAAVWTLVETGARGGGSSTQGRSD